MDLLGESDGGWRWLVNDEVLEVGFGLSESDQSRYYPARWHGRAINHLLPCRLWGVRRWRGLKS